MDVAATDSDGYIHNICVTFTSEMIDALGRMFDDISDELERFKGFESAIVLNGELHHNVARRLRALRDCNKAKRFAGILAILIEIASSDDYTDIRHSRRKSMAEKRLDDLRIFCTCNMNRNIPLSEEASYLGMNPSALCTFIKRQTGKTFTEYLNEMRLIKAKEVLLTTEWNIGEIADQTGFSSLSYFHKIFRNYFRCTPRSIRNL